jgi:hypothetical protein
MLASFWLGKKVTDFLCNKRTLFPIKVGCQESVFWVGVHLEGILNVDIKKGSSLPLRMTLSLLVIPNPSNTTLRTSSVKDLARIEPLPFFVIVSGMDRNLFGSARRNIEKQAAVR